MRAAAAASTGESTKHQDSSNPPAETVSSLERRAHTLLEGGMNGNRDQPTSIAEEDVLMS